jgi:hypothetical protein
MMGPVGGISPPSYKYVLNNNGVGGSSCKYSLEGLSHNPSPASGVGDVEPSQEPIPEELPQPINGTNKWKPTQCIPKVEKIPKYEIHSEQMGSYVQFMKDHTVIGKFWGYGLLNKI